VISAAPCPIGSVPTTLVPLRNKSTHGGSTATRADASFFATYVSTFLEELGWENLDDDPVAASTAIHPFDLFKDFDLLEKVVKPRRYARSDQQDVSAMFSCMVFSQLITWTSLRAHKICRAHHRHRPGRDVASRLF
jgi:hypothetical protein